MHARGRASPAPDGATARLLGAAYDTTGERRGRGAGHPGARGDAGRLLLPRPRVAVHPRQRRGGAAARAQPRRPARRGALGRRSRRRSAASSRRTTARPCGPAQPVSFDAYYPAPLDGWYELRAWPTPDGLSVYFLEVTERRQAQEQAERAARRLALLAQVSAELAGTLDVEAATARLPRHRRARRSPTSASSPSSAPTATPGTSAAGTSTRPAAPLLERYAEVRLDAMPMTAPVARALHTGEAATFAGDEVLDAAAARARPASCSRVLAPDDRGGAAAARPRPDDRPAHAVLRRRATPPAPTTSPSPRTSPTGPGLALDNARLFSASSSSWPRGCSAACSPSRPSPTTPRSPCATCPPPRPPGSAATGTTRSCSPAAPRCWSSATSSATTPRPPPRWASCAACCAASPPTATPARSRCCAGWTPRWRPCRSARWPPPPSPASSRPTDERERGVTRMRWANAGHLPPLVINPDGTRRRAGRLGGRPAARRRRRRPRARESVVTLDRGADRAALHRRADRAARRRPRRRAWSGCATHLTELADLPLRRAARRAPRAAGARPAGRRRRAGRRPAAPAGPAATGGGRAQPRAADRARRSGVADPQARSRRTVAFRPLIIVARSGLHDLVGGGLGHLDQREPLVDLDRRRCRGRSARSRR